MGSGIDSSRRFYENVIAPMIHDKFGEYENRIAVGLVGEGSDCFGYDDFMSRDHDFGTGVCLWFTDEDMNIIGNKLSDEYNALVARQKGANLTRRLSERRGVMTIRGFYSNILGVEITEKDIRNSLLSDKSISNNEEIWNLLDHNCLATAVNGEVFRDDLGEFTSIRQWLLDYYPDRIWKIRIVNALHKFSAALQVNYARCMTRGDVVAARLCHMQGIEAAMELFFLMKRKYPPYYKWTYKRLTEIDVDGTFSRLVKELSEAQCDVSLWEGREYRPNILNMNDRIVAISEQLAGCIVHMLRQHGFTQEMDPYLERYVDVILSTLS